MSLSRKHSPITRRTVLRGLGAMVALPWLESARPVALAFDGAGAAGATPSRMAFFFVPNGVNVDKWFPGKEGTDYELTDSLKPLAKVKDQILVMSGLAQNNGRALGDGPGDHARSLATFLTGVHPRKTDGSDIRAGISVDQLAAQKKGRATRFPSLELGLERGAVSGNCDSGYSCAYSSNIAWSSPTTPLSKEIDPQSLYDRLFGDGIDPNQARRQKYRQSVLDLVRGDADRLKPRLGVADRRKLEDYFQSVREIEIRLARIGVVVKPPRDLKRPEDKPEDLREHSRLMLDLLAIALQGDLTRVGTFMFANEGSNRTYPFLGVNDGHHELSHHEKDEDKLAKIQKIDQFHVEQFAYFLEKLQSIKEGERTLLDSTMVLFGSGIGDGNRHNHNDLPIVMAGNANGTIKTGRHVVYPRDTPLCNLYLSMLDRFGAPTDTFGDSTGRLDKLEG